MLRHRLVIGLALLFALAPALAADDALKPDEELLKKAGVDPNADGLLAFLRKLSTTDADVKIIKDLIRQLGHDRFDQREDASRKLLAWGTAALGALKAAEKDPDLEVVHRARTCVKTIESGPGPLLPIAAARLLAARRPPAAIATLVNYIGHASELEVQEAVLNALVVLAVQPGPPDPALLAAVKDPVPMRRASAGFALGRARDPGIRDAVRPLLADRESIVRLRTVEGMLAGRDRGAVPALIDLTLEPAGEIGWRVDDLLYRLAGDANLDLPSGDDPPTRKKRRDLWAKWWKERGDKVNLDRIDSGPPFLNLTLVPEMHADKVWEYDARGKTVWEITTDLKTPIDAQVLPNGRVLIAELGGHRVTERDRAGKILWQKAVQTPIACQRLGNGHTFIGTNARLLVVDSTGKELWDYKAPNGFFIHSVQRLKNGHYAMVSMGGKVTEIDATGKEVRSFPISVNGSYNGIEGVAGNRYLVVNSKGDVIELDAAGKIVWQYQVNGATYASRLPNGNTFISCSKGLIEVDKSKKIVSERKMNSSIWRAPPVMEFSFMASGAGWSRSYF